VPRRAREDQERTVAGEGVEALREEWKSLVKPSRKAPSIGEWLCKSRRSVNWLAKVSQKAVRGEGWGLELELELGLGCDCGCGWVGWGWVGLAESCEAQAWESRWARVGVAPPVVPVGVTEVMVMDWVATRLAELW